MCVSVCVCVRACVRAYVFYITVPFFTFYLEMIKALNHQLDVQWRRFGTFLHVSPAVMERISKDKSNVEDCMLHLIEKWLWHEDGTGNLPRTWQTVVQAVQYMGNLALVQQLAQQHIRYDQGKNACQGHIYRERGYRFTYL